VEQMREESERGVRKREEMWFKTTAEDGETGGSSDEQLKTVFVVVVYLGCSGKQTHCMLG